MKRLKRCSWILISMLLAVLCPTNLEAQTNILDSITVQRSVHVHNLEDLNTPALEFSPTVHRDSQLYYVSSLNADRGIDPEISEPWFIWFRAPIPGDGSAPNTFYSFNPVGEQSHHLGPMDFSEDGRLFYTANPNREKGFLGSSDQLPLQLFQVRKRNEEEWGTPSKLPFVREGYDYCHPSWNQRTNRLYFSSNQPGGSGEMDIYYVTWSGKEWSQPVNAGQTVNSSANEVFPFIDGDGALFFSSDRTASLDIYLSLSTDGSFLEAERLPEPFNSEADDLGFYLGKDHRHGYLSSNRTGGWGKDDLYAFRSAVDLLERTDHRQHWEFVTWDARADQPIEGVEVRPFPVDQEGKVQWPDAFKQITVHDQGDSFPAYRLKDPTTLRKAVDRSGQDGRVNLDLSKGKDWKLFFTAPDYRTVEWNAPEQRKEGSVMIKMHSSKCVPYRIVVQNTSGDKVEHAQLTWSSQCDRHGGNGQVSCLHPHCTYTVIADAADFQSDTLQFEADPTTGDTSVLEISLDSSRTKLPDWTGEISRGNVIVMENIYYDYNEAGIRPGAAKDLEILAKVMQRYPSLRIELIAHTDARGDKYYNLKLSLRRAESAKKFLVERGISSDRIRALGYGESQIRNHCEDGVECTEEEHEYNRRTEVRFTSIGEDVNIRYRENLPE